MSIVAAFFIFYLLFFILNLLITKIRWGYWFYTDAMFQKFWSHYSDHPPIVILKQWIRAHRMLSWQWFRAEVYINKYGVFVKQSTFLYRNFGVLYYFDPNDASLFLPPRDGLVLNYKIEPEYLVLTVCSNLKKKFSYELKIKIDSISSTFKIEKILKQYATESKY